MWFIEWFWIRLNSRHDIFTLCDHLWLLKCDFKSKKLYLSSTARAQEWNLHLTCLFTLPCLNYLQALPLAWDFLVKQEQDGNRWCDFTSCGMLCSWNILSWYDRACTDSSFCPFNSLDPKPSRSESGRSNSSGTLTLIKKPAWACSWAYLFSFFLAEGYACFWFSV